MLTEQQLKQIATTLEYAGRESKAGKQVYINDVMQILGDYVSEPPHVEEPCQNP